MKSIGLGAPNTRHLKSHCEQLSREHLVNFGQAISHEHGTLL